jgi:ribosomal protein L37AE/L43A
MRIDQIEIHTGPVGFEFQAVRQLEARCEAKTAMSKAPTIADVNLKLQEMAAGIGANAVIDVKYDSGMSLTSWRSMKATGLAVLRVADDIPCPMCAETIKRAAKKCRHCGADLAPTAVTPSAATPSAAAPAQPWAAQPHARSTRPTPHQEPLRATDNPVGPMVWIAVVIGLLILFGTLAS